MFDRDSGLTQEYLKSILFYDPETGHFTWRVKLSNRIVIDDVAGSIDPYGYVRIKINVFSYKAHRLAWFYITGEWPKEQIDHKDRIRHNNKWENLREATRFENAQNKSVAFSKIHELKGAYQSRGVWFSTIMISGKNVYLGEFDTPEEAHAAYVKAANERFKEFATAGKL